MAVTYADVVRSRLDLSPLGFARGDRTAFYFCTPRGATILGWAGVDGIHFCRIRRFGDRIFSVNPMNGSDYVQLLARNFEDFLRLLLACGHTAALEQAHAWSQMQFDAFLQENPITEEQQVVLTQLQKRFSLSPMEQPFAYLKAMAAEFDPSAIPYRRDFFEWVPEEPKRPQWKVYANGGFCSRGEAHARPGRELSLDKEWVWAGRRVRIPAVYVCGSALVLDVCIEVDPALVNAFLQSASQGTPSYEEQERMPPENPLQIELDAVLQWNGHAIRSRAGSSVCWMAPDCLPQAEGNEPTARWVLEHYGLDASRCWVFWRLSFPRTVRRKPVIRELAVTLMEGPKSIPGPCFRIHEAGESVSFVHPVTGTTHRLKVLESQPVVVEPLRTTPGRCDPTHLVILRYTIEPPVAGTCSLCDVSAGDAPQQTDGVDVMPVSDLAEGAIGGADGPTVLFFGDTNSRHTVASSRYIRPPEAVEWRLSFRIQTVEDCTVPLINNCN